MEEKKMEEKILNAIRKIMYDKRLTQAAMADMLDISPSQFSKVLKGTIHLSLDQVSNLATSLKLNEIDLITYPDVYRKVEGDGDTARADEPVEAVLQIKLRREKREQVLKLVFGDNDIEILNK